MEILVWILLLTAGVFVIWKYMNPKADVNNDGKVDAADVKAVVAKATESLDANKDGKVDAADVKVAVQETVKEVKTVAKQSADVNKDGKVDTADVKTAVKKTVKKAAAKAEPVVKKAGRPKKSV